MKLRDLPKGVYRTRSGYLRYSSPKELRNEYVHRKVIADCLKETPWSILALIPYPYEVHHQDYNKEHNCPGNLLILSIELHSIQTADGRGRHPGGKFMPKWKVPHPWMPLWDEEEVPW